MDLSPEPSKFYTGLVAQVHSALATSQVSAEECVPFLKQSGGPTLQLACGTGYPLLELVARGYAVHGLDSSQEMLARCRENAVSRGINVALHHGEMQSFSAPRAYQAIFLAGPSFTLLTSDRDAMRTLARIRTHLVPGGSIRIPLEIIHPDTARTGVRPRRTVTTEGDALSLELIALSSSPDQRSWTYRLRYARTSRSGASESLERDWRRRWWSQEDFSAMLRAAGFRRVTFQSVDGGQARPDARAFIALAEKRG